MPNSTRYFQLTPDIMVEYTYTGKDNFYIQTGNVDYIVDLSEEKSMVIDNGLCSTRTFLFESEESDFVLPINKSESRFILCAPNNGKKIWNDNSTDFGCTKLFDSVDPSLNTDADSMPIDKFRLHFTSRNYLGSNNYDGFIINVQIYDRNKNKIGILSKYIRKDADVEINETPILINQKLYTTYIDFRIPNVYAFICSEEIKTALPGVTTVKNALFPRYSMLENTPMIMGIYGVKSTINNNNYDYYTTEKLNTIYIPIVDKSNNVEIMVDEASDGDYFKIYPRVNGGRSSFSDYLSEISDGRLDVYIVFYELTLTERFGNSNENLTPEITHREQFIINAVNIDGDINESELDRVIYYRPVLRNTARVINFTIDVRINIINTLDNTTTVIKGSCSYGTEDNSAKKYGKRMNRIYLGEVPAQVNVYNKKPDIDIDSVKITNASSNVTIQNHQHSIIGFIECANVGVSIEQIPTEQIN